MACLTSQQPTFYLYHITFLKEFSWRQDKRNCPSWQLKNWAPQKFSDLLLYARALFCKTSPIASDWNKNKLQTSFLAHKTLCAPDSPSSDLPSLLLSPTLAMCCLLKHMEFIPAWGLWDIAPNTCTHTNTIYFSSFNGLTGPFSERPPFINLPHVLHVPHIRSESLILCVYLLFAHFCNNV